MDINKIVDKDKFLLEYNLLDSQSKEYLKKYGQAKNIQIPKSQKYNKELANTKTKEEVTKNKEQGIITGISLIIISFIFLFLANSIEIPKFKKMFSATSAPTLLAGGVLTFVQISSKSKYNNSKAAEEARNIKKQNETNAKQFYADCLDCLEKDYQRHIQYLITNPTPEDIQEYKQKNLSSQVEQEFFDKILKSYKKNSSSLIDREIQQTSLNSNAPCVANSIGCSVKIIDDYIIISKGNLFKIANFFDTDANDVKIPLETITVINYKQSGVLDGYLEFVYQGFIPRNNDTVKHAQENVITFRGDTENQLFKSFKELAEKKIREIKNKPTVISNLSVADELSKLVELKDNGILTEEEFQVQKQKIINS